MVLWVPSCMLLWGMATALHTWVRARWQLYLLRILIGCLEGKALSRDITLEGSLTQDSRILSRNRVLPFAFLHPL
jgi:hypothetical protein